MLFVSNQKVKLRVLFNLNAQLIESFDRCVTCEEVLWTWSKGNDLQIRNARELQDADEPDVFTAGNLR